MHWLRRARNWQFAAIPYLLLTVSQQAGVITYVSTDGSGERMVYCRAATSRVAEASRHLQEALPQSATERRSAEGEQTLLWRDAQLADLNRIPGSEAQTLGIVQTPLSIFTRHSWKEEVSISRGDATELELAAQPGAALRYVVRMPGRITETSPGASTEGNKAEWRVKVGGPPQTLSAESVSIRWTYLVMWLYVLAFVASKAVQYAPRVTRRVRRKPRKI